MNITQRTIKKVLEDSFPAVIFIFSTVNTTRALSTLILCGGCRRQLFLTLVVSYTSLKKVIVKE